jgi:hypothetical protein
MITSCVHQIVRSINKDLLHNIRLDRFILTRRNEREINENTTSLLVHVEEQEAIKNQSTAIFFPKSSHK